MTRKKIEIRVASGPLKEWQKLLKIKNIGVFERFEYLLKNDIEYLKTLKYSVPDLTTKTINPMRRQFILDDAVLEEWRMECTRLDISPRERLNILLLYDIEALEKEDRRPINTSRSYQTTHTLPVVVGQFIELCKKQGVACGNRVSVLLERDTGYLKSRTTIQDVPFPQTETADYSFVVDPEVYDAWQAECARLGLVYSHRIYECILKDIPKIAML